LRNNEEGDLQQKVYSNAAASSNVYLSRHANSNIENNNKYSEADEQSSQGVAQNRQSHMSQEQAQYELEKRRHMRFQQRGEREVMHTQGFNDKVHRQGEQMRQQGQRLTIHSLVEVSDLVYQCLLSPMHEIKIAPRVNVESV
jgi:hypothetical protein